MDHAIDINSEEELLGLKNEGKISDSEYADLLSAMRKPSPKTHEAIVSGDEDTSKQKYGKIAFYLMLAGIVVPTVVFFISFAVTGGGEGDAIFSICAILCVLLELPAFVLGVISWPDVFGKTVVATIFAIILLSMINWMLRA